MSSNTYPAPALESLLEALRSSFRCEIVDHAARPITYLDTFDWRLHRAGGCLRLAPERSGPTLSWLAEDGTVRHRMPAKTAPPFAGDFPPGALRRAIEPVIAMRRLLVVVDLRLSGCTVNVLDRREKTVVRLHYEEGRAAAPESQGEPVELPPVLRVQPIRGYDRARQKVVRYLERDLGLEPVAGSEYERALHAIGRQAGDYTSKAKIELDPAMPAGEAAKLIHRTLLATLRRNEAGTRRDLDSEFLHDFRVAIRRTRSALSQLRGVFPAADVERFKGELRWLGGVTGPTRDLDVYLLKMDGYKAELAEAVRQDIEPLQKYLVAEQRRAQRRMVRQLDSSRCQSLLADWEAFLQQPAELDGAPNAGRPIAEVASERIWKVYRRVIKEGLAIDQATPAEALHDLRIRCKKLRYLMEFFRGLYDPAKIGKLIKALKQLQDNLGDFNDYEVQQMSLAGFGEDMQRRGAAPAETLMAMGRLIEHLAAGQQRERDHFAERFARFSRPVNRQLAEDLFGPRGGAG